MRIMRRAWGLTAFVAAALMLTNGALSASDAPVVHVKAVVKDGAVTLDAQANGPFEYTTYRPSESLYVLDLSGVSAGDTSGARVVPSELVKSYRLTTYSAGQKPVVRLEILLRPGITPRLARTGNQELTLFVSANGNADASAEPVAITAAPAAKPAPVPAEGRPAPASLKPIAARPSESGPSSADFQNIEQVNLAQVGAQTEVNVVGNAKLTYHVSRLHNHDAIGIVQAADVIGKLGVADDVNFGLGANLSEVHLLDILEVGGRRTGFRGPGRNRFQGCRSRPALCRYGRRFRGGRSSNGDRLGRRVGVTVGRNEERQLLIASAREARSNAGPQQDFQAHHGLLTRGVGGEAVALDELRGHHTRAGGIAGRDAGQVEHIEALAGAVC